MSDTVPQASALLKRALKQLVAWQAKYGDFNPKWLPPAGDVRLAEDIGEYLASQAPAPAAIAEQLQPSGASPAAVEERKELCASITNYLSLGGCFNPELADHAAVRALLIDCRAALASQPAAEPASHAVSGAELPAPPHDEGKEA